MGGGGGRGRYLSPLTLSVTTRTDDLCNLTEMGSDESHLVFHNCEGQSHKTVSIDHKF